MRPLELAVAEYSFCIGVSYLGVSTIEIPPREVILSSSSLMEAEVIGRGAVDDVASCTDSRQPSFDFLLVLVHQWVISVDKAICLIDHKEGRSSVKKILQINPLGQPKDFVLSFVVGPGK